MRLPCSCERYPATQTWSLDLLLWIRLSVPCRTAIIPISIYAQRMEASFRKKDTQALCQVLRHRVLTWLTRQGHLSEELCKCMLSWKHSGFSLDASIRISAQNRHSLEDLLLYMYRHPFTMRGIHYNSLSGDVHYQAPKMHQSRNTDHISTDAVEFIAWLSQHIPHARKHQVRHYGACAPEVRKRLGHEKVPLNLKMPARTKARGRRSWARLI